MLRIYKSRYSNCTVVCIISLVLLAAIDQTAYTQEVLNRNPSPDQIQPEGLQEEGRRGLGAQWMNEADVMSHILALASEAAQRLQKRDVSPSTRELQRQIVAELDKLLASAGAASAQPNAQPMPAPASPSQQAATERQETAAEKPGTARAGAQRRDRSIGEGTTDDWRSNLEAIWGRLPPRERPPLTQQTFETFIPKYRALIESYYRELSRAQKSTVIPGQPPGTSDRME